jgi:hypothetical protein
MRPLRLLPGPLVAGLLAAILASPAGAAPGDPLALSGPADGAQLTAGVPLPLRARGVAGDAGVTLRVSASPQPLDACGRIGADVAEGSARPVAADPALFDFAAPRWYERPGTYFWQAYRAGADGSCTATEVRRLTLTAATAPELAGLSTEPIPSAIGHSNGATFVIRTDGLPPSVSRARFLALVRNSGRRWRLHSAGTRPGRPAFGNGTSEVGFSNAQIPRGALGVTIIGRPVRGRRERDLILRADVPWEQGPNYPTRGRIDLETVLLHELGHVAGNQYHVPRACTDTPMIVALDTGEWWRSTVDFSYRGCNAGG